MKVLTFFAPLSPKSFCHAVLEQFTQGLKDAGSNVRAMALCKNPAIIR
jgi:hypothetical protein